MSRQERTLRWFPSSFTAASCSAVFAFAGLLLGGLWNHQTAVHAQQADEPSGADAQTQSSWELTPVETDPHDFMEYIHQPTYRSLKEAIASEPQQEAGWKTITSDALVLAEAGNLLMMRPPQEKAQQWLSNAVALRDSGAELYRAAKENNYETARERYASMIQNCNQCHDEFNNGRPNLQP